MAEAFLADVSKLKQISEATTAIGFATGALEMLAIVCEDLNEGQKAGIHKAIDGLRKVDPLALAYWPSTAHKDNSV